MQYQIRVSDDPNAAPFKRKERLLLNDEGYFYHTREQDVMGPFDTECEALYDLHVFIQVTQIEMELQQEFLQDVA